jgi:hypothetical protein
VKDQREAQVVGTHGFQRATVAEHGLEGTPDDNPLLLRRLSSDRIYALDAQ